MPKFEVVYTITRTESYSLEVTAKDEDTAQTKAEERIGNAIDSGKKLPGSSNEEEDLQYDIEDCIQLD